MGSGTKTMSRKIDSNWGDTFIFTIRWRQKCLSSSMWRQKKCSHLHMLSPSSLCDALYQWVTSPRSQSSLGVGTELEQKTNLIINFRYKTKILFCLPIRCPTSPPTKSNFLSGIIPFQQKVSMTEPKMIPSEVMNRECLNFGAMVKLLLSFPGMWQERAPGLTPESEHQLQVRSLKWILFLSTDPFWL